METVQYIINQEAGPGAAFLIVAIIIFLAVAKAAWQGTLSEEAQKRNNKRSKKE